MDIKPVQKPAEPFTEAAAPNSYHCSRCCRQSHFFTTYATPVAVLIGSALIAASVLFSGGFSTGTAKQVAQTDPTQTAPPKPVEVRERADAPVIGDVNAPVTLIEFSDFQCPFCQRFFQESYPTLKSKYVDTGKVKVVFRHFPLPFHQNAQKAAEAAECASRQGKFTEYHDVLFTKANSDGAGLAIADLKTYAKQLNLDAAKFNQCLDNAEAATTVSGDLADGQAAGVNGTPTFVLNGQLIVGAQPLAVFDQALGQATAGK